MKKKTFLMTVMTLVSLLAGCADIKSSIDNNSIIPKPLEVKPHKGSFTLTDKCQILLEDDRTMAVAKQINILFSSALGYELPIVSDSNINNKVIKLKLVDDQKLLSAPEAYTLQIRKNAIEICASANSGLYYGIQTLRQLLPPTIEAQSVQDTQWIVSAGYIYDKPRYDYRGAMLDVARHFYPLDEVKAYIDYLAMCKLNYFHIHLSDDQGWRIEIKSWPLLTEVGSVSQVGGGDGGFYTQEQYKDIVAYAAERFITVIPEIDMPGHTNAALHAYPELNLNNETKEYYTGTEVGFSTLAIDKEITYTFLDDVIREIAAITPGKYFHIGGDESHATEKADYIKFINNAQKIVSSYDKEIIGWADISEATLEKNTIAQFWKINTASAQKALDQNAKIIMSPANYMYLDMKYDSTSTLGLNWAGYVSVEKAYSFNPGDYLKDVSDDAIIGLEMALWSETVKSASDLQWLVLPRLLGNAEIAWSAQKLRSWDDYSARLASFGTRLDVMEINYYKTSEINW